MSKIAFTTLFTLLLQCFGCGQFFVLSSVAASPEGQVHVFDVERVHVCQTNDAGQPVCTQIAKH
ncbi:MAG: hypothetical protein B7733_00550 [Myxococcales bacterium FL481]|nr:MAG: hypothetical protein B7733_00550 [Myxococcales bacterium FL481]